MSDPATELRGGPETTIIRRILDRDETILSLAGQLETAVPLAGQPDLTMRQLLALHLLSTQPRHVGEIAAVLGIMNSSASGLVDRLVRSGLVSRTRSPADRRVVICQLTSAGGATLREYLEIGRLRLERVLTELSGDELVTVEHALDLLIGAARAVIAKTGASPSPLLESLSVDWPARALPVAVAPARPHHPPRPPRMTVSPAPSNPEGV